MIFPSQTIIDVEYIFEKQYYSKLSFEFCLHLHGCKKNGKIKPMTYESILINNGINPVFPLTTVKYGPMIEVYRIWLSLKAYIVMNISDSYYKMKIMLII